MAIFIIRIIALLILTTLVPIGMGVIYHFAAHSGWIVAVLLVYLISMIALVNTPEPRS